MLEVYTTLKHSNIQGIGLFAAESIPTGKVVWRYNSLTSISWSKHEWEDISSNLPLIAFTNIERFAYFLHNKWILNLDDSRFMNHSATPNLRYDQENETCYALKNIENGEELTTDYREFCEKTDTETCQECGLCDVS